MDDRDRFAAAALTGLLEPADVDSDTDWWKRQVCAAAYAWADAMLIARSLLADLYSDDDAYTDGVSAAIKSKRGNADERQVLLRQNLTKQDTQEPVAWAVEDDRGLQLALHLTPGHARFKARTMSRGDIEGRVVPLYRSPVRDNERLTDEVLRLKAAIRSLADQDATLSVQGGNVTVTMGATITDAERTAIQRLIEDYEQDGEPASEDVVATLRGLLERLHDHCAVADEMVAGSRSTEPVAWAALRDDGDIAWIGYTRDGAADGACDRQIVPLYRSPTLTDAEREAVRFCSVVLDMGQSSDFATTLRGLLERTK